jgi:hypothetical protein
MGHAGMTWTRITVPSFCRANSAATSTASVEFSSKSTGFKILLYGNAIAAGSSLNLSSPLYPLAIAMPEVISFPSGPTARLAMARRRANQRWLTTAVSEGHR